MAAEAIGVFFYVYAGISSVASFFLNGTEPAFGSLLQVGFSFAFGMLPCICFLDHVLCGCWCCGNDS